MKKVTYIFILLITVQLSVEAQADLEVESIGIMEKTLVVASNTTSGNTELVIGDYSSDGSSIMNLKFGVKSAIIGIDNNLEGIIGTKTPESLSFWTNTFQRLTIEPLGDVGLGTTNPGAAFHVREPGIGGIPTTIMVLESAASNKPAILFSEGGTGPGKTMGILYNGSGSGPTEKLQIINDVEEPIVTWTNNEFMGIGTETPRQALDVDGNIAISAVPGSLILQNSSTQSELTFDGVDIKMVSNNGNALVSANRRVIMEAINGKVTLDAADDIFLLTDNTIKMNCNDAGNWGLNKLNPTARFHLKQNAANIPAIRIENNSDTDDWDWEVDVTSLRLSFNGVEKGSYNFNGVYTGTSDYRLKEEIVSLKDGALSSVLQLKPCSYFYNKDIKSTHRTIGFIAQEMEEHFPVLVSENDNEDSDILGVNYAGISVVAVKAIQEQNQALKLFKDDVDGSKVDESKLDGMAEALEILEERISKLR